MKPPGRGESGIALLVVLLAITLLTIVVIEFTETAQVETHLALSTRNALQANYLARSGVNVAEAILGVGQIQKGSDSEQEPWAQPYPPLPIGDGTAVFRVRDESRFLNLNEMLSAGSEQERQKRIAVFHRLFENQLGLDRGLLPAIIDWMDADSNPYPSPLGAEVTYYLGLNPPRTIRNAPFITLRELLLVRGVTPTVFARLAEFVTVLPPANELRVNVNTAPRPVLLALSAGTEADPGVVDRLISSRTTEAFREKNQLFDSVTGLHEALGEDGRSLVYFDSAYFRIEAVGEIGDVRRGIIEVVKRDQRKVTRLSWTPSTANLALTSQPPSDFLATLPALGGS